MDLLVEPLEMVYRAPLGTDAPGFLEHFPRDGRDTDQTLGIDGDRLGGTLRLRLGSVRLRLLTHRWKRTAGRAFLFRRLVCLLAPGSPFRCPRGGERLVSHREPRRLGAQFPDPREFTFEIANGGRLHFLRILLDLSGRAPPLVKTASLPGRRIADVKRCGIDRSRGDLSRCLMRPRLRVRFDRNVRGRWLRRDVFGDDRCGFGRGWNLRWDHRCRGGRKRNLGRGLRREHRCGFGRE
jgi:hypothetical protein